MRCRDADPARREQLARMNAEQQLVGETSVERAGYALLDALGVSYERQHRIGPFCVDAFTRGTVVQFDGDYWHGNPAKYPLLNDVQARSVRRDRSHDAYMRACGYSVVRLWGSELLPLRRVAVARVRTALTPV